MADLYQKVLEKTTKYLGGNAKSFVDRQLKSHLNIEPEALGPDKLPELAKWIGISASLLIDREKADALKKDILAGI